MKADFAVSSWLGRHIDPRSDPWYRFGRVLSLIDSQIMDPIEGKWLDVGCQIGQFLHLVKAKYGIIPTGIDDFNEGNVVEVCRRYLNLEIGKASDVLNDSWQYFSRRIDQTGFDINEKFDFVSALEVIEHMIDTDAFIRECRSHLKDGGYFVVTTPNINSLRNRIQVPMGIYPSSIEYRNVIHHVRIYNPKMLKMHVEKYNFQLVVMSGVNFLPRRMLGRRFFRNIDQFLCQWAPSLCGNVIAIFKAR